MCLCITVTMFWFSVNLFFPGMVFCIHGVTLSGTPLLSICFLWMVSLKFKVKWQGAIFPLEIRVRNENVSGFA